MSQNAPEQPTAPDTHPDQTEVPLPGAEQAATTGEEPRPTQASEEGTDDEEDLPDAGPASGPTEMPYVQQTVDKTPNAATESDEQEVLRDLYGEPDEEGFYRGDGPEEEPEEEQEGG